MLKLTLKSDTVGILSSLLCLIHCFIGPFIFMVWTSSTAQSNYTSNYWYLLDFLFLIVSFWTIYKATKQTRKAWFRFGFWSSWILLSTILINEKIAFTEISEALIFVPTFSIIVLHIFNLMEGNDSARSIRISRENSNC
jgi:hypothetical protein